jgi:hypothetical protein
MVHGDRAHVEYVWGFGFYSQPKEKKEKTALITVMANWPYLNANSSSLLKIFTIKLCPVIKSGTNPATDKCLKKEMILFYLIWNKCT